MRYLLIALVLSACAGCGQKGPLVLPQEPPAPPAPATSPAPPAPR